MSTLWLVPLVLLLDQASKRLVAHTMVEREPIKVIGDFFQLTYIHNPGAAFGLNLGSPLAHTLISMVALLVLVWMFWSAPAGARLVRWALAMVLGGALGNIVDRFYLGEVIDFFDFGIGTLRWPVFNVADSFVSIGVVLLAFAYSRPRERHRSASPTHSDQAPEKPA